MKQDKHKKIKSARYKKQHGITTGKGENKTVKSTAAATDVGNGGGTGRQVKVDKEHDDTYTRTTQQSALIIEKLQETRKEYSRRKIESNWAKYEDFIVDDDHREVEVRSESRGEDFQKLVSKSDDAASHLRMKDEVWWDEDDQQNETETEIGKLFQVDFVDVARRLEAIPLHERLGISTKYIDDDLLAKINEDAAEHAKRYQDMLDSENAQDQEASASSDITNESTPRGPSEQTLSASKNSCELDRLQQVTDENNTEQICNDASRTLDHKEQDATDLEPTESPVPDGRTPITAASNSSCSHLSTSSSSAGILPTSSNRSTLSVDVNESQTKPEEEEENLEEWLDDLLDE